MVPTEGHSPTNGPEKGQLLQETPVLCQGVHFSLISPQNVQSFEINLDLVLSSSL